MIYATFFVDRSGKFCYLCFPNARAPGGFSNVERNAEPRAVNRRRYFFWLTAESFDHELTELLDAVLLQFRRFVNPPMLDRKIRHGEKRANFLLDHLCHAVSRNRNGNAAL